MQDVETLLVIKDEKSPSSDSKWNENSVDLCYEASEQLTRELLEPLKTRQTKQDLEGKLAQIDSCICSILTSDLARIQYSVVSSEIYRIAKSQDQNESSVMETMVWNLGYYLSATQNHDSKNDSEWSNKCKLALKLRDHIQLAILQSSKFNENSQLVANMQREAIKTMSDAEEKISEARKEVKDTTEKITTNLISIVAIFTGIAFILFGGVSALGGIREAVVAQGASFPRVISYTSLTGSFILGAVMLFFWFLLIVTNRSVPDAKHGIIRNTRIIICILIISAVVSGTVSIILEMKTVNKVAVNSESILGSVTELKISESVKGSINGLADETNKGDLNPISIQAQP